MTRLTAFEAGAFSPWFVLVGILFASLQSGLEALDYKRHFLLVVPGSLYLCHSIRYRLLAACCLEGNGLWLVEWDHSDIVSLMRNLEGVPNLLGIVQAADFVIFILA
jgi:hypothetical protein